MRLSIVVPLFSLILTGAFVQEAPAGETASKPAELTKENVAFFELHSTKKAPE